MYISYKANTNTIKQMSNNPIPYHNVVRHCLVAVSHHNSHFDLSKDIICIIHDVISPIPDLISHFRVTSSSDGALHRTRLYCYSLDQSRVVRPLATEKNYHVFYQMMAGLSQEERAALDLKGYSLSDLSYLNRGNTRTDETEEVERFNWKVNLVILGIPCMDVLKVMTAILLLGKIKFLESGAGLELDMNSKGELQTGAGGWPHRSVARSAAAGPYLPQPQCEEPADQVYILSESHEKICMTPLNL